MRKKFPLLLSVISLCSVPLSVGHEKNGAVRHPDQSAPSTIDPRSASAETISAQGEVLNFDRAWRFKAGGIDSQKPEADTFNDTSWRKLDLPHDFAIENDFTGEGVNGEVGHLKGGIAWYRKNFIVPQALVGKAVSITFNGVMSEATIYVNGTEVGFYPSGYLPITFDITNHLRYGEDQINSIAVRCLVYTEAGQEQSRWYTGGGIYRDVILKVYDATHVKENSTKIETLGLKKSYEAVKSLPAAQRRYSSEVNVTSALVSSVEASDVTVRTTLLDYWTRTPLPNVAPQEAKISLKAGQTVEAKTVHRVEKPVLWQPWDRLVEGERPQLYFVKTEVVKSGKIVQTKYDRFGFRYTDWYTMKEAKQSNVIKAAGFYLNGERYTFHGVALHHDQGALGAVANDYAIERQVQTMKKMGANAIRGTHNHQDPAMLRSADENGLLFVEEFFDTWYTGKKPKDFHLWFEKLADMPDAEPNTTYAQYEIKTIVERDRNFPSVVMFSVGNEIWELYRVDTVEQKQKGLDTVKALKESTQKYDVTPSDTARTEGLRRFVTMGQDDKGSAMGAAQFLDSIGDNYNKFTAAETEGYKYYGSETSSALGSRGVYVYGNGTTLNPGNERNPLALKDPDGGDQHKFRLSSLDNNAVSWGLTASEALRVDQNNPAETGQFIWTGFDYIGEPTPWNQELSAGKTPKSSYFGIVDTAGFAKDNYYLYQSQWLDFKQYPMAHIVAHYNWEEEYLLDQYKRPDGKIPVRVYTNAPSVELYLQKPGQAETLVERRKTFQTYAVQNDETVETYRRNPLSGQTDAQSLKEGELFQEFAIDKYEYVPGTSLKVKIYDADGKEVTPVDGPSSSRGEDFMNNLAHTSVITAGKPYAVELTQEREVIQADGQALAYVTAQIVDDKGVPVPNAENLVQFHYVGDPRYGKIVGVDNGDASSWERFKDYDGSWQRNAFYGKALVIAQASREEGAFSIAATSPGLKGDAVTVMTSEEYQTIDMDEVVYASPNPTLTTSSTPNLPLYFDTGKERRGA